MSPPGSPLATGIEPALFSAVDVGAERFGALARRAAQVRSRRDVRTLAADCFAGESRPLRPRRLGAAARAVVHFDLRSADATLVAAAVLWRAAVRRTSRKTLAVLLVNALVRRALGPEAVRRPPRRELLAMVDALERVFAVDDVVDDAMFMDRLARTDDPATAARVWLAALPDVRALIGFVDSRQFASERARRTAQALACALEANTVATLALLAGGGDHDSATAMEAVLGISSVLAELTACLCLAPLDWDPDDRDGGAATAMRDAGSLAVHLQCLDDFLDCVDDGRIYGGATGLNVFRCLVHERDPQAFDRLRAMSRFDPVAVTRAFPAEVVRYFTALGSIELTPAAASAAGDSVLLYDLKDLL